MIVTKLSMRRHRTDFAASPNEARLRVYEDVAEPLGESGRDRVALFTAELEVSLSRDRSHQSRNS